MSTREPNATEKIAALHIELEALKGDPICDWETLKKMSPEQICKLFQWHHTTYDVWIDDPKQKNHPTVLKPLYWPVHRERTAKIDQPIISKIRRILKKKIELTRSDPRAKPKLPSRKMRKQDAKFNWKTKRYERSS
jgi:hypothetical protein